MKIKFIYLLSILVIILFAFPQESFSKGDKRGGSRGGSYKGGSHKGGSYKAGSYKSSSSKTHTGGSYKSKGVTSHYSASRQSKPKSSVKNRPALKIDKSVKRDSKGRIVRSESVKEAFLKSRGLKSVPKGYEVDHKVPLYAGGKDAPSNMQLLTKEQHRIKTKEDYKKYGR